MLKVGDKSTTGRLEFWHTHCHSLQGCKALTHPTEGFWPALARLYFIRNAANSAVFARLLALRFELSSLFFGSAPTVFRRLTPAA
jgi:hypothetical protein